MALFYSSFVTYVNISRKGAARTLSLVDFDSTNDAEKFACETRLRVNFHKTRTWFRTTVNSCSTHHFYIVDMFLEYLLLFVKKMHVLSHNIVILRINVVDRTSDVNRRRRNPG